MNDNCRIIKKYPNRRLYDTAISSYVTFDDVRQLILGQTNVKIIDARSEKDLTTNILLQIFMNQEEQHSPLLSQHVLEGLICSYNKPNHDKLRGELEGFLNNFFKTQQGKKASAASEKQTEALN